MHNHVTSLAYHIIFKSISQFLGDHHEANSILREFVSYPMSISFRWLHRQLEQEEGELSSVNDPKEFFFLEITNNFVLKLYLDFTIVPYVEDWLAYDSDSMELMLCYLSKTLLSHFHWRRRERHKSILKL